MKDIAEGMDYLHTREPKIIHRDLKSSNILVIKSVEKLLKQQSLQTSLEQRFAILGNLRPTQIRRQRVQEVQFNGQHQNIWILKE